MEPASLPADSRELYQEGLIIPPVRLDDELLTAARSRTCATPTSAAATCERSSRRTGSPSGGSTSSCERHGRRRVAAAMDELYAYSERVVRAAIAGLPDGRYEAADVLEPVDGELEIRAAVTIAGDEVEIDFAGTSPQHDGQPQLPARGHALGLLLRRPLPDRAGPPLVGRRLRARHASRAPAGSLVNARSPAAVVAGNTETSSRIVDVVFAALRPGGRRARRRGRGR